MLIIAAEKGYEEIVQALAQSSSINLNATDMVSCAVRLIHCHNCEFAAQDDSLAQSLQK